MQINSDDLQDACVLYVISQADHPLCVGEIREAIDTLTEEEKLDAIARYQENKGLT